MAQSPAPSRGSRLTQVALAAAEASPGVTVQGGS
jgi:hypothetical protein